MISVEGLGKLFAAGGSGTEGGVRAALEGVTLAIQDHEFVSVIGPSGCGKTTLLRIIGGLIPADAGQVVIDGAAVTAPGPDRAIVFQDFALLPWADLVTNVAFPLEIRKVPRAEREARARAALRLVDLEDFAHYYPRQISGGMQQRVGLARALAVGPKILLMDEPFGALDAQTRQGLQEELTALWQRDRKTVLFVTHAMDEAVYLSDRVVIMTPRPGRVAEVLDIPLPRPRGPEVREDPAFARLTNRIWERLKAMGAGREPAPGPGGGA
jgi:ABC-type nitrate/sulfonate/bicarbonate transport system ATPase subunit